MALSPTTARNDFRDLTQRTALDQYRDALTEAHATYGPYIADFPCSVRNNLNNLRYLASRYVRDLTGPQTEPTP